MNNTKNYFTFLAGCSALFLLLFFIVSYYNRLAADDLYYMGNYREVGVWGCMQKLYFNYSGRWLAYLLTGWVVSLNKFKGYQFVFNVFTLVCLIAILHLLIHKLIVEKLKLRLSNTRALLFALLLTGNFFFTSYSIGETWFWLVTVCIYLWSIIMCLYLLYALMDEKIKSAYVVLILISALFIGGSSESYALVVIFMLATYLFLVRTRFGKYLPFQLPESRNRNIKIGMALALILLAFTITMLAPGNKVRYGALPNATGAKLIVVQLKSFIKIIFIRTPLKLPYLILFSFPWFILGRCITEAERTEGLVPFLQAHKKYFLLVLALIFIFLIPTSFIMVELGPDRSLSQISFFIASCFSALFFVAGTRLYMHERAAMLLRNSLACCMVVILIVHVIHQYAVTRNYAAAVDSRTALLSMLNEKGQKGVVALAPLPPSGMLYTAEITEDTAHFSNHFLEQALHLRFSVKTAPSLPH